MIDSELYVITRKSRFFWQSERQVCLVVAYYDDDAEKWKAKVELHRRAKSAANLMHMPIEKRLHKRVQYD